MAKIKSLENKYGGKRMAEGKPRKRLKTIGREETKKGK